MAMAQVIALREAIAFADLDGGLPGRNAAEIEVMSRFHRIADTLFPELGSDRYEQVVDAAWRGNRARMSLRPYRDHADVSAHAILPMSGRARVHDSEAEGLRCCSPRCPA
jgi:hypothetical protein